VPPRAAWALAVVTLVLVVADAVVTAQYRPLLSEDAVAVHGFPFVDLAVLGCSLLGALVLARDSRHPIGLLLILIGVTSALSVLAEAYGVWVMSEDGPGPRSLGGVSGWLSVMLGGQLAICALAVLFLLVPDGRLLTRRWRYAVGIAVLGEAMCFVALFGEDPSTYDVVAASARKGPFPTALSSLGFLLISVGLLASVAAMLVRLHRSRGEVRQQMRVIALASGLLSLGLANVFVVELFNGGQQTWFAALPLFTSYVLMPLLFGFAILRYRLYDIEVILNRTLILAIGTGFAALGYTGLVVTVGKLVDRGTSGLWVSLVATTLVALAFQPLRRRVVWLANRIAYGSRAQPYEALSDFSRRIAENPSPRTLLEAVARAAGQAVSAEASVATLDTPGAPRISAQVGTPGPRAEALTVAVRHATAELGSIRVWLPRSGVRPADKRLLDALADQAAVVFHNIALHAELEANVERLDRTTRDLARSRSRIVEADNSARRAMETAISREVLPHLVTVPAGIAAARAANAAALSRTGLDELVHTTNTALDALRRLTRGLFPTQLARSGLEAALATFLARRGMRGILHFDEPSRGRRYPAAMEAAVYSFCVAAVHELPDLTAIELSLVEPRLVVALRGARCIPADLQPAMDRAEAIGGSVRVIGDELVLSIPVGLERPQPVLASGLPPEI
jgi:signal transduction histidine kinase